MTAPVDPPMVTIPVALRAAATRFAAHEAVVDAGARLTFATLASDAEDVARALVAAGVQPGDRVAIWAPNSSRWIVASFGVYLAGAVLVPLNTRYKGKRRPTCCAARRPGWS